MTCVRIQQRRVTTEGVPPKNCLYNVVATSVLIWTLVWPLVVASNSHSTTVLGQVPQLSPRPRLACSPGLPSSLRVKCEATRPSNSASLLPVCLSSTLDKTWWDLSRKSMLILGVGATPFWVNSCSTFVTIMCFQSTPVQCDCRSWKVHSCVPSSLANIYLYM